MDSTEIYSAAHLLFPGYEAALQVIGLALIAALVLTPAEYFASAHPQPLFFRKGMFLDLCYWFFTPLVTRCITGGILAGLLLAVTWVGGFSHLTASTIQNGFGPLSRQNIWLQALEILLLADFVDYWTHRTFHHSAFWPVHAIHHSPEEMNWLSSSRVHPLNDLVTRSCQVLPMVLLGFSANAILSIVPLISFYVMFLHSNIKWSFGAFRFLLVSPAYHRWHHTSDKEGLDKNFAGIFPMWDLLFGTFYLPSYLPKRYGLKGETIPESFKAHMAYPLKSSSSRRGAKRSALLIRAKSVVASHPAN